MNDDQEKAVALAHSLKPEPTWFFERGDGKIFACGEREAWDLMKNKSEWMRRDFKLLGQSSGETYCSILKNGKSETLALKEQIAEIKSDIARYIETENKLKFEQLKDDDDEMVVKVREKIKVLKEELGKAQDGINNISQTLIDKAFNAELEIAKQNVKAPSNQDVVTPQEHERSKILTQLGK